MSEQGRSLELGGSGSLSARQREEQAERIEVVEPVRGGRKRGRKRKIAIVTAGVLLLLVGIAPTVVGMFGKGVVESRLSDALGGDVRIEKLGLSWFGAQRVRSLRVVDGSLREAADVDVRVERSLIGLALNWKDLGRVVVSGEVTVDDRDGPIRTTGRGESGDAAPSAEPARLPKGLRAELRADGLDVTYRNTEGSETKAEAITGSVRFGVGSDLNVDLATLLNRDGREGRIEIRADVASLTDSTGVLTPEAASATGTVSIAGEGLPIGVEAGEAVDLGAYTTKLTFTATSDRGSAELVLESSPVSASIPVAYSRTEQGYRVEASKQGTLTAKSEAVAILAPELAALAAEPVRLESGQEVTLDEVPGLSARIDELALVVPTDGSPLDLRSAVVRGRLETGGLTGTLDGEAWEVEPLSLDVTTRGVTRGVSVQAVTTARLGGQPAGVFVVNAEATDLFDESTGRLPGDEAIERLLAGLRGGVEINDVEGALLDSLAGAWIRGAGVSVAQDIGSRVDAEIAFEGGDQRLLRLFLNSENVRASAGFVLDGSVIRSDGAGLRLNAESAAPFLSRRLGLESATLTKGGGTELWVRDVVVDLDRLRGDGSLDLRAVKGQAELRLGSMTGTAQIGEESHALTTSPAAFTVDLIDIASGAGLAGAMTVRVEDRVAGELSVSLRATEIVDAQGRLMPGLPKIDGEVTLRNAMTSLAQPMVESMGFVLAEDIGPKLDVIARANVDSEGVVGLRLDAQAAQLTGAAELAIADRSITSTGQGVSLELRNVGKAIGRVMPDAVTTDDGGGLSLKSTDLTLAMGERGVDWSRTKLGAQLGLRGVRMRNMLDMRYQVDRLDLGVSVDGASGEGVVELSGIVSQSGEPVATGGKITAFDLIRDGELLTEATRLDGRIDIEGVPIALAAELADDEQTSTRTLAAQVLGRLVDVSVVADGGTGSIELGVKSDRMTGRLGAQLDAGDLRVAGGSLMSEISPEVIEQIRLREGQIAGKAEPIGARFIEPARVELTLEGFGLLEGWKLAPEGMPELRLSASGMVEGLPLRRGEIVTQSGPIGFESLVFEGRLPVASLLGGESGSVSFALASDVDTREGRIGSLTGGMDIGFEAGRPHGAVRADLELSQLDAGLLDDVTWRDGLFAGVLGAKLVAEVEITGELAGGRVGELDGQITIESPRVRTETPVKFAITEEAIALAEPAQILWTVVPEIATRYGFGQPVGAERVHSTEDIEFEIEIDRLSVSRGDGPLLAGVFGIDARVEAPRVVLDVPSEQRALGENVVHTYEPVYLHVVGGADALVIDGKASPAEQGREPLTLAVRIETLSDDAGRLAFDLMKIDGQILARETPTAMVDGLLSQKGLMLEVLGPNMTLDIKASDFRPDSGALTLDLQSTRASGKLVSKMFEGRLIAIEPAELVVREVRPELGSYIGKAVPVIGAVTKGPNDGPAKLTVNTLEVPIFRHSELSRVQDLHMEAVIDLGTARFQTSSVFTGVMKVAQQRTEGGIGRKMSPINLTVNSGVIKYPRTKIPIGEFTIESAGQIRLTDGYIDVVTYIPMVALTEEGLGRLKTGLTSFLGRQIPIFESLTMAPWRTKGVPGNRKTTVDAELLLQNVGDTLNPVDLINKGLGSLQDLVIDKPKEPEKKDDE